MQQLIEDRQRFGRFTSRGKYILLIGDDSYPIQGRRVRIITGCRWLPVRPHDLQGNLAHGGLGKGDPGGGMIVGHHLACGTERPGQKSLLGKTMKGGDTVNVAAHEETVAHASLEEAAKLPPPHRLDLM